MNDDDDSGPDPTDRLIRQAGKGFERKFRRPTDEDISAFLAGIATPAQRDLMLDAMARSEEFHHEIRDLAQDLADLESPAGREAFGRAARSIEATQFVRKAMPGRSPGAPPLFRRFNGYLLLIFSRRPILGVAATAVVVVAVLIVTPPLLIRGPRGWAGHSELAPRDFERYRGGEASSLVDEQHVAIAGFQDRIRFVDGVFSEDPPVVPPALSPPLRHVSLQVRRGKMPPARISADVPASSSSVTAWLFALPSCRLFRAPVASDSARVSWQSKVDSAAWVLFTFQTGESFAVTPAERLTAR
jgi:hypothetical protein